MERNGILKSAVISTAFVVIILLIYMEFTSLWDFISDPAWIQMMLAVAVVAYDIWSGGKIQEAVRKSLTKDLKEAIEDNSEDIKDNTDAIKEVECELCDIQETMGVMEVIAWDGSRAVNSIVTFFDEEYSDEYDERLADLITMDLDTLHRVLYGDRDVSPGDFTEDDGYEDSDD